MQVAPAVHQAELAWTAALADLQVLLTPATFNTWLRDCTLVSCDDDTFVIAAPNDHQREWLDHRLRSTITRTLNSITGHAVDIRFVVAPASMPERVCVPTSKPDKEPTDLRRKFLGTHRFLAWLPILGPVLWCLILCLRQRCYWNKRTGEMRDECICTVSDLAAEVGVSERTARRQLAKPEARWFIACREVLREQRQGHWQALGTRWTVKLIDPKPPPDGYFDRQAARQPSSGQNDRLMLWDDDQADKMTA